MAKITLSFFRDIYKEYTDVEISMSRLVEKLNEEAERTLTRDESGVFGRDECVFNYCPTPEACKEYCKINKG